MLFLEHGFRYVAKWNTLFLSFSSTSLIVFAAFLWITYVPIITNIACQHILFYFIAIIHVYAELLELYVTSLMSVSFGSMWNGLENATVANSFYQIASSEIVAAAAYATRAHQKTDMITSCVFSCLPVLAGVNCFMFNDFPHRLFNNTHLFYNCNPELNP